MCNITLSEDAVNIAIDAPPREGEANIALAEYLAEILGIKKRDVTLCCGGKSHEKIFRADGITPELVLQLLRAEQK